MKPFSDILIPRNRFLRKQGSVRMYASQIALQPIINMEYASSVDVACLPLEHSIHVAHQVYHLDMPKYTLAD